MIRFAAALALVALLAGSTDRVQDVSIVALIANPAVYDGKLVAVRAYGVFEFEHAAVYLAERDADYLIAINGVRVIPDGKDIRLPRGFVYIEGEFKAGDSTSGYSGVISKVHRVVPLKRPSFEG